MSEINNIYLDNDFAEEVSLFQVYQILFWLRTGYKICNHSSRVPAGDKKFIISHFNMNYCEKKRRYQQSSDVIFQIFKNDFSVIFEREKITEYNQLVYLAT